MHADGMDRITIGELSRRTGLPVRTLRFYSDRGLVAPAERSPSGYRLYEPGAVAQVALVRTLRALGVDLPTIGRVHVGPSQTWHAKRRAPITAMRRPRISMAQRATFDPASLPGGAGIPAFHAPRSRETHSIASSTSRASPPRTRPRSTRRSASCACRAPSRCSRRGAHPPLRR